MSSSYKSTQRWRFKARAWITEYAGNKCQSCGYNTYIGNLTFHHLDRTTKDDTISRMVNATAAMSKIIAEADKCVLVCHNCHGEIHAGIRECPAIDTAERRRTMKAIVNRQPVPKSKQFHNCRCGKRIDRTKMYCSHRCAQGGRETITWPDNLPELVAQSSLRNVGLSLGVSDKAVSKRLKNHHTRADDRT